MFAENTLNLKMFRFAYEEGLALDIVGSAQALDDFIAATKEMRTDDNVPALSGSTMPKPIRYFLIEEESGHARELELLNKAEICWHQLLDHPTPSDLAVNTTPGKLGLQSEIVPWIFGPESFQASGAIGAVSGQGILFRTNQCDPSVTGKPDLPKCTGAEARAYLTTTTSRYTYQVCEDKSLNITCTVSRPPMGIHPPSPTDRGSDLSKLIDLRTLGKKPKVAIGEWCGDEPTKKQPCYKLNTEELSKWLVQVKAMTVDRPINFRITGSFGCVHGFKP